MELERFLAYGPRTIRDTLESRPSARKGGKAADYNVMSLESCWLTGRDSGKILIEPGRV